MVYDFSSQCLFDVIVLVETWLNPDFYDAEFFDINLYNVYRKDRNAARTGCTRGGGVLVAVKKFYKSSLINIDDNNGLLDQLIVSITGFNIVLHLSVSYIPPNISNNIYSAHVSNILSVNDKLALNSRLCVLGDFNLSDVLWTQINNSASLFPLNVNKFNEIEVIDSLLSINLIQINHIANSLNRFLDLIFVPYDYFNFNLCKSDVLNSIFNGINWMDILSGPSTSSCYDKFVDVVLNVCKENIPLKKKKPYKLPWYTRGLKRLKNLRNKFHKRFVNSGSADSHTKFIHYQREFNCLNKFLYRQYILGKENEIRSNPKYFWSFIKSRKQVSDIPKIMNYGDKTSVSCSESVNMFAEFFESNFKPPSNKNYISNSSHMPFVDIGFMAVSEDEVFNAIMNSKDSYKSDIDGFCGHLLKICASSLKTALTFIFNLSLKEGIFIDKWKFAAITPVFKDGRRDNVTCRSTTTNLSVFTEFCIYSLEQRSQVDTIYTDFSKAFDKVSHNILIDYVKLL
ncbi:uncharacterized protein LOC119611141 [Lucilia sericata]|uniref:uncharacterized protein LOC119611141 n=1 Tax=Lucilia sericata TaxID=13632 RepID=UPI0018A80DD1|nr:uncharacterized protein LOC119611141 [Lucilia sericata]